MTRRVKKVRKLSFTAQMTLNQGVHLKELARWKEIARREGKCYLGAGCYIVYHPDCRDDANLLVSDKESQ